MEPPDGMKNLDEFFGFAEVAEPLNEGKVADKFKLKNHRISSIFVDFNGRTLTIIRTKGEDWLLRMATAADYGLKDDEPEAPAESLATGWNTQTFNLGEGGELLIAVLDESDPDRAQARRAIVDEQLQALGFDETQHQVRIRF